MKIRKPARFLFGLGALITVGLGREPAGRRQRAPPFASRG
jgi:hypothetical protein